MPRPKNTEAKQRAIGRHRSTPPKPRKRFAEELVKSAAMMRGKPAKVVEPVGDAMIPPPWLSDRDRETWSALLPTLQARLLKASDLMAFGRYCVSLGRWLDTSIALDGRKLVRTQRTLRVKGMQRLDRHFDALLKLEKVLLDLEDRLAMNPRARIAIMERLANTGAPPPDRTPKEPDEKRSPVGWLASTPPPRNDH